MGSNDKNWILSLMDASREVSRRAPYFATLARIPALKVPEGDQISTDGRRVTMGRSVVENLDESSQVAFLLMHECYNIGAFHVQQTPLEAQWLRDEEPEKDCPVFKEVEEAQLDWKTACHLRVNTDLIRDNWDAPEGTMSDISYEAHPEHCPKVLELVRQEPGAEEGMGAPASMIYEALRKKRQEDKEKKKEESDEDSDEESDQDGDQEGDQQGDQDSGQEGDGDQESDGAPSGGSGSQAAQPQDNGQMYPYLAKSEMGSPQALAAMMAEGKRDEDGVEAEMDEGGLDGAPGNSVNNQMLRIRPRQIDWKDHLAHFTLDMTRRHYERSKNLKRPNRRLAHRMTMPGNVRTLKPEPDMLFVLDTSSSLSVELLRHIIKGLDRAAATQGNGIQLSMWSTYSTLPIRYRNHRDIFVNPEDSYCIPYTRPLESLDGRMIEGTSGGNDTGELRKLITRVQPKALVMMTDLHFETVVFPELDISKVLWVDWCGTSSDREGIGTVVRAHFDTYEEFEGMDI